MTQLKDIHDTHIAYSLPSRHHVIVVDNLDERLNTTTLGDLLLAHSTSHLQRSTFDTSDNCITIRSILGTFIVVCNSNRVSVLVFFFIDVKCRIDNVLRTTTAFLPA